MTYSPISQSADHPSTCYGTTSKGALTAAVKLPKSGDNYVSYSTLGWALGRTYVHSAVAEVVLNAYQKLHQKQPDKRFMYAETGWSKGGVFRPHKTHQNGLSVDFMVPVLDENGHSSTLPVGIGNRWGYDIEFDAHGQFGNYQIDFKAMAEHLNLLVLASAESGIGIEKVYFDPRLQAKLLAADQASNLASTVKFNDKQAWVRHDEHFHVDFKVACKKLSANRKQ